MCPIPKVFRYTVPKLLITKIYYVLFLIPVFIVQVTKLVQFTYIIHFRKFHRQHQCTLQLVWAQHTAYWAFVKMCGIFYNTPTMSLLTVKTATWPFTPIHVQEGGTVLGSKSKLLYSEMALSRKPFGIVHMYVQTIWPPRILTSPFGTICISRSRQHSPS
jgi:hypothetical protein